MEHEDREEIPWSSLVAELDTGVDRRWWIAGGAAVLVVAAILAFRVVMSTGGQPEVVAPAPAVETIALAHPTDTALPQPALLSEADLRAEVDPARTAGAQSRAEWFVLDYYTVDGSTETSASIRSALGVPEATLPHDDPLTPHSFVEWARTIRMVSSDDPIYVFDVAFRTIGMSEEAFVRQPVRAVRVEIEWRSGVPMVVAEPVELPDVWGDSF